MNVEQLRDRLVAEKNTGQYVAVTAALLEELIYFDGDTMNLVRSLPNPERYGIRSPELVAWIGDEIPEGLKNVKPSQGGIW